MHKTCVCGAKVSTPYCPQCGRCQRDCDVAELLEYVRRVTVKKKSDNEREKRRLAKAPGAKVEDLETHKIFSRWHRRLETLERLVELSELVGTQTGEAQNETIRQKRDRESTVHAGN